MPKTATESTPTALERYRRFRAANKAFLDEQQRLAREIARSEYAIERLRANVARMTWDSGHTDLGRDRALHESLLEHNRNQLPRLEQGLLDERAALEQLRASRPVHTPAAHPDPKVRAQRDCSARYREAHREELATQARERRARAKEIKRMARAVATGELDIFS